MFKQLHIKSWLLMLFMVLGASNAWADESKLTFTSACGGSGTADDGVEWTVTSDGTESSFDSSKGIHYGTGSAAVQYIKLNTSDIQGTITKVVVNASTASGVTATVDVTVGGAAFGGDAQSLTSNAADYTFEGSASGEIEVTVTKPSSAKKALYVKSIFVTYSDASKTDIATEVSVKAPESLNVGDEGNFVLNATYAQNATYTVAWESSKPEVLAVNGAAYEAKAAGKAEVTVKITPTDQNTYNEVSYNFSVTVVDPNANDGSAEHPYTVAEARAAIDAGTGVEGVYAKGIVSKIVTAYNSQFGNITYDISADGTVDADQLRVYRGFSYNGDWFTSEDDIQVGDVVVIKGDLTKYNSTYEFTQGNQLVSLERTVQPTKTETTVTISGELTNLDVYTSTEAGTLTATVKAGNDVVEGATVTWSSSNENVATIDQDGKVTLIAKGTVTFTAAYAGDATYAKSNATTNEYTVTSSEIVTTNSVVFNFENKKSDYGSGVEPTTESSYYEEAASTWKADKVTLVINGKYRWWDNDGTMRIYANDPVSTITVSVPNGYVITNIAITGGQQFKTDDNNYNNGKWEGSAQTVVLAHNYTKSVNVKTITVTYKESDVADLTLTVRSDAGWTSYVANQNVTFPTSVKAYTVTAINEETVTLTEVTAVKAYTPVLVNAAKGSYTLEAVDEADCDDTSDNLLKASDGTVKGDGQTIFALGQNAGTVGLYLVGADVVIPAGKAYLQDAQATGGVKAFDFGGETAIQNVEATNLNAPIYNVAGQRVNKAVKGLYIQNGRKFIVK